MLRSLINLNKFKIIIKADITNKKLRIAMLDHESIYINQPA